MNIPPYTLSNDSITVIWEGKPHTVQRGAPQFLNLRKTLVDERWEDVPKHLTVVKSLQEWAKGKFTLEGETFFYNGEKIQPAMNERIRAMAAAGEDPARLFRFYERLQKNPSFRSVQQLWGFLQHQGIPLTEDGRFLAYKSVRAVSFLDHHSGTVENKPGAKPEMDRNKISDDPSLACHDGYHVGALSYAQSFGSGPSVIVICMIDPENVVCIPYDSSQRKMRICKYEVIGIHNGELLSSTSYDPDVAEEREEDLEDEEESTTVQDAEEDEDLEDEEEVVAEMPAREVIEMREVKPAAEPKKVKDTPKGEEKKKAPSEKKLFAELDALDMTGLMQKSLGVLRHYASKKLKLIGASKLPGGKTALAMKILEIRGK